MINTVKNKVKIKSEKKCSNLVKKRSRKYSKTDYEEEKEQLFYKIDAKVNLSKESKRKRRYSNSSSDDISIEDHEINLLGDFQPQKQAQKENNCISKAEIPNLNFKKYADRENERKISIVEGNSPERNPKGKLNTTSEDNRPYQASTYYSNTINKSSKKSGFKFSSDFFSFEEDEVNHEKTNKNKEIFGILSEDDFEKFSSAIEQDYQNKKQKNRISSHKKPFAS